MYVMLLLFSGQPLVYAKLMPVRLCDVVAARVLPELVAQPGVLGGQIMCVPQGNQA